MYFLLDTSLSRGVGAEASVTCWGTGTPKREFLHVDDLADACVFALERWKPSADHLLFECGNWC